MPCESLAANQSAPAALHHGISTTSHRLTSLSIQEDFSSTRPHSGDKQLTDQPPAGSASIVQTMRSSSRPERLAALHNCVSGPSRRPILVSFEDDFVEHLHACPAENDSPTNLPNILVDCAVKTVQSSSSFSTKSGGSPQRHLQPITSADIGFSRELRRHVHLCRPVLLLMLGVGYYATTQVATHQSVWTNHHLCEISRAARRDTRAGAKEVRIMANPRWSYP
ncbi:hypothetical protein HDK77DRAFT_257557 [Phyllosticta capitalensis]